MKIRTKKGAASIYVVVFSSLVFGVITVAFIKILIKDSIMTNNDSLAQTAYDSAMAGIEDAKIALKRYYSEEIEESSIFSPNGDNCDLLANALGRPRDNGGGVMIQEVMGEERGYAQAYTCVILKNNLSDYRTTLSIGDNIRVIPLKTGNPNGVNKIRIAWYSRSNGAEYSYADGAKLPDADTAPIPPVLSAQILQTSNTYKISDFDTTSGQYTDRATVFLVPTSNGVVPSGLFGTEIGARTLYESNDHDTTNSPQIIRCRNDFSFGPSDNYACVATLTLPKPIGGSRIEDTFFLILSSPYDNVQTDISVELYDDDNQLMQFKDAQVAVDSTGRAGDLFVRLETRVELNKVFPFPEYVMQITGEGDNSIDKSFYTTSDCWKINTSSDTWEIEQCNNSGT